MKLKHGFGRLLFVGLLASSFIVSAAAASEISRCSVKAGRLSSTDSMMFSGLLSATVAELEAASEIVVSLDAADMDRLDFVFPVDGQTYRAGTYRCVRRVEASHEMFTFLPSNGRMIFLARNVDLTGLSCPITVTVTVGAFSVEMELDESVVNGSRLPCPPQFLMGVRDWMMVNTAQVRAGRRPGTDILIVRGYFAVEGDYNKSNPMVARLGGQTFTVAGNEFTTTGTLERCARKASQEGPRVTAQFNFSRCSFLLQVTNAVINDSGQVAFEMDCFGHSLPAQAIAIAGPAAPRYELERYRCYNASGRDWTYSASYGIEDSEGLTDSSGTTSGTVGVGASPVVVDGHACYPVSCSTSEATVSSTWYEDYYGMHMASWGNANDMVSFEAETQALLAMPTLLSVGQRHRAAGAFTGDYDLDLDYYGMDVDIYDFRGTASVDTTLLGFESVTVPYGSYSSAAKVQTRQMLNGSLMVEVDYYGRIIRARLRFQATIEQTWWGVEDLGIVKISSSMMIRMAGGGENIWIRMSETDELTGCSFGSVGDQLPVPSTSTLAGRLVLPEQSPLQLDTLVLTLISDSVSVGADGSFSGFSAIDEDNPQNVIIEKENGTLIATAVLLPADIQSGYVTIGADQMALGLINMNPYVMVLPSEGQVDVLGAASSHPDFSGLVTDITNALIDGPELMMDYETYPYIFQKSLLIGIETIQELGESQSLVSAYHNLGISASDGLESVSTAAVIGDENDPHIRDAAGGDVTLVNPKMVFYGVQANDQHNLIRGKDSLLSLLHWDFGWTAPTEKDWLLGEGTFHLTYYKGFNVGTEGWLSYTHGAGKATYANFVKAVFIILDIAGIDVASLSNAQIEALMLLDNVFTIDLSTLAPSSGSDFSWQETVRRIQDFIAEHWDEFAYWVWQESSGWTSDTDQVTRYLRQSRQVIDGILSALGPVTAILDFVSGEMVNEQIPFFYDLAFAPPMLEYSFVQSNGVISVVDAWVPPTAYFSIDKSDIAVGETVTFDASSSYDDIDEPAVLQVRWDFDGNGAWDTSWTTSKSTIHTFSQRGTYYALLEVRDSQGLTSLYSKSIYVGSSEGFKVVLSWGAEPRDLDSHLITPSIGGSIYHIYYASRGSASSAPYAWLDLDDVNGYGPETIWFEDFFAGTYVYSVYLYSGSGTLNTSQAHVEVISSSGVVRTFTVPTTGSGRWWNVFSMDGPTRTITPINTLSDSQVSASSSLMSGPLDSVGLLSLGVYMPPKDYEE